MIRAFLESARRSACARTSVSTTVIPRWRRDAADPDRATPVRWPRRRRRAARRPRTVVRRDDGVGVAQGDPRAGGRRAERRRAAERHMSDGRATAIGEETLFEQIARWRNNVI